MMRFLLGLLLVLSLLFNVFFLIGSLNRESISEQSQPDAAILVADRLGLDASQSAIYRELRAGLQSEVAAVNSQITSAQAELIAEMAKPTPDVDRMREILNRKAELQQERTRVAAGRFEEFVRVLRPEQVREMSKRLGSARLDLQMSHETIERFDADGDNKLDAEEKATARHWDRNRNGRHEPEEIAAYEASKQRQRQEQDQTDDE